VGIIGAVFGYGVGAGLALSYGPVIFKVTSYLMKPEYALLGWSLIVAPLFAALSSFIPTVIAITQDPARILSEE
jgi:ABC-type antimicrobial peptide transport system permease subunit